MIAGFDAWGHYFVEPPTDTTETRLNPLTDKPFLIDWQRRRLVPIGESGKERRCLHGSTLLEWCDDCERDLDALAADMLP